jgi:hypothetical protein
MKTLFKRMDCGIGSALKVRPCETFHKVKGSIVLAFALSRRYVKTVAPPGYARGIAPPHGIARGEEAATFISL